MTSAAHRPLGILQVVESLDTQAIETWLRRAHSIQVQTAGDKWTFFCTLGQPGRFEPDVVRNGAAVVTARSGSRNQRGLMNEIRELAHSQQFDVIHAHHDVMSALYLWATRGMPIKRFVHVHNTSLALPTPNALKKSVARPVMRAYCLRNADRIIGVSKPALASFVGARATPSRDRVLHCGIEVDRFSFDATVRAEIRSTLGIPENAIVLLFAGRLIDYKNPCFAIEVLSALRREGREAVLIIAGDGPLDSELRSKAAEVGVASHVHLTGFQEDIGKWMSASDVLIAPTLENPPEGLGLAIVEAQASGLGVVMSQSIPDEAIVITETTRRTPLSDGAQRWASAVLDIDRSRHGDRVKANHIVARSSFSIVSSAESLSSLYRGYA